MTVMNDDSSGFREDRSPALELNEEADSGARVAIMGGSNPGWGAV